MSGEGRPELRVSVAHDLAVIDFLGDFARVSRRRKSRYWGREMRLPGIRIPVVFFIYFFGF